MSTRIIIDQGASNTAKLLAQSVNSVITAKNDLARVKAIMDKAQSGDPADWAALATELGLQGADSAQQAQDAWTITATALGAIDVGAVAELARLDQG